MAFTVLVLLGAQATLAPAASPVAPAARKEASGDPYLPSVGLKGRLVVVGSQSAQPLISQMASRFMKWQDGVVVAVETDGSGEGFDRFLSATRMRTRPVPQPGEEAKGGAPVLFVLSDRLEQERQRTFIYETGIQPLDLEIALGAVAVYVHASNPIETLSLDMVDAIFGTMRKQGFAQDVTLWGQLGLTGEWAMRPIHVYGRQRDSMTRALFQEMALLGGDFKPGLEPGLGANPLILAISNDPAGIGYADTAYEQYRSVKAVGLAERQGGRVVKLTPGSMLQHEDYPLARRMRVYLAPGSGRQVDAVSLAFLRFIYSQDGQEVISKSGFSRLPLPELEKQIKMVDHLSKGK